MIEPCSPQYIGTNTAPKDQRCWVHGGPWPCTFYGDCASCGEGMPIGECSGSKRPCGHHCNHVWTHDECDWCFFVCEVG